MLVCLVNSQFDVLLIRDFQCSERRVAFCCPDINHTHNWIGLDWDWDWIGLVWAGWMSFYSILVPSFVR